MIALIPILSEAGAASPAPAAVLLRFLLSGAALAAVFIVGRTLMPHLLRAIVSTRIREVFLLAIILLCLGTAWASARVGLSLALGAFIAGLVISESEYSHQALGEILPLREVFNSLFFISIGMLFDVRTVIGAPFTVFGAILIVLLVKALITTGASIVLGQSLRIARRRRPRPRPDRGVLLRPQQGRPLRRPARRRALPALPRRCRRHDDADAGAALRRPAHRRGARRGRTRPLRARAAPRPSRFTAAPRSPITSSSSAMA